MTEESIINLIEQLICRHGTIPIGEIGKQMQLTTQNPGNISYTIIYTWGMTTLLIKLPPLSCAVAFLKLFKKRFGGLKKFILTHPNHFDCGGEEHNFNPMVSVISLPPMGVKYLGEREDNDDRYGYGAAGAAMHRPRQDYDAFGLPAHGLSRSFPGYSAGDETSDTFHSASYAPPRYDAGASIQVHEEYELRGQSFKQHHEVENPRRSIGYREIDVTRSPKPAPRYEQQKPLSYGLNTEIIAPGRYQPQSIGQARDGGIHSRPYHELRRSHNELDEDSFGVYHGQVAASPTRYPQQPRRVQQPPPPVAPQAPQMQPRETGGSRYFNTWN
jgi:hypothetical protein